MRQIVQKLSFPFKKLRNLWQILGPGLITGASDDDPSGIATYSQAGAAFGLTTLWTAFLTFPMMASIQEMCARIGIVTSKGLAKIIKVHYPRAMLYLMMLFSFPAIIFNIGADLAGMGAVSNLLFPQVPSIFFTLFFSLLLIVCLVLFSYPKIAAIMKWLCLSLLVYLIVPFLVKQDWRAVLYASLFPKIEWNKDFVQILVAILGTTISPYLFFWQTSMSVEDSNQKKEEGMHERLPQKIMNMRLDVNCGMVFSNLVMFFIILTTGSVLHNAGITQIETVEQAAQALKPLAGNFAYLLFALGVIGTGFLAIPVLAGCLSYVMAEIFDWPEGMNKKFWEAKGFYITMIISILVSLGINLLGISPIKALIYTAVVYGITAPILIAAIIHICNNKKVMGAHTNSFFSNLMGGITLLLMASAAFALLFV